MNRSAVKSVLSSVQELAEVERKGLLCPKCAMRFDSIPDRDLHMEGMCVTTEAELRHDCFRTDESDFAYFLRRMRTLKSEPTKERP